MPEPHSYLLLKLSQALFHRTPSGLAPEERQRVEVVARRQLKIEQRILATPEAAEYLNDGWDEVRPLVEWLVEYVGESETQSRR